MELGSSSITIPFNSTENIATAEHLLPDGGPLNSDLADIADINELLDTSPQQSQLHGGQEEPYQNYPQKSSQPIENYGSGDYDHRKHVLSPQDHSIPQYMRTRYLPGSPPDSGSEPCFSPPENIDFNDTDRYINHWNLGDEQLQHDQSLHQQRNHSYTLPGGNSPSAESPCSQHSGGSSAHSSYMHSASQDELQEFENTLDSVRTSDANSGDRHHGMNHIIGDDQGFHRNENYPEQQVQSGTNYYVGPGQDLSNVVADNDIQSPISHGLPRSGQEHIHPLMDQLLSSRQINEPPSKKRKAADSLQELNVPNLKQHYQMLAMQHSVKQEPGLTPPTGPGYYNNAYDIEEAISRHQVNMQSGIIGGPELQINSVVQMPPCGMSGSMLPHNEGLPPLTCGAGTPCPSAPYMVNSTNKAIKWAAHQKERWCQLLNADYKNLRIASYRVDADKGFTFAVPDDTFVCQKKNHFQVTVHINLEGNPAFVKTEQGPKKIEAFYLNLYGVKCESINQTITIEQSQSDRSKKPLHPVKVDLPANQVTKVTVGRLHFSETTSNNMRKKGRPNPDQRYFMCVVAIEAQAQGMRHMVCASQTEKIIVRASNPGQFDSDQVPWQSGTAQDSIFHVGKVGIDCSNPDEALVVHGNVKLTGRLMQPSDMRAKENIEEVNNKDQLKNVQNIRIVRYQYTPEYCKMTGIDPMTVTTGVIAQEFQKVLPNAVKETGNVQLSDGNTIPNFLVVDKDQLYMENVGAVKELCNLTSNFETRIEHLEKLNNKLSKLRKYDSVRSNISCISGFSTSTGSHSVSRVGSARYSGSSSGKIQRTSPGDSGRRRKDINRMGDAPQDNSVLGCFNQKLTSGLVIGLFVIMLFSFVAMSTLYAMSLSNNGNSGCTAPNCILRGENSTTSSLSTVEPHRSTESQKSASHGHAKAISYCPDDGKSKCGKNTEHCCGGPAHGTQISMTCTREYFVSQAVPNVLSERPSGRGKTKPPNAKQDSDSEDKTKHDGIDSEPSPETLRKPLPASQMRKRVRRSSNTNDAQKTDDTLNKNGLKMTSVRLVEPDVILYDNETKTKYVLCNTPRGNLSFNVPISMNTPAGVKITMEFNTTVPGHVYLCTPEKRARCTDMSEQYQPAEAYDERFRDGNTHRFVLLFSSFVSSDYWFHLATYNKSANCNSSMDDLGKTFHVFRFHFYRPCTIESNPTHDGVPRGLRDLYHSNGEALSDNFREESIEHPSSDVANGPARSDEDSNTSNHDNIASNNPGIETRS